MGFLPRPQCPVVCRHCAGNPQGRLQLMFLSYCIYLNIFPSRTSSLFRPATAANFQWMGNRGLYSIPAKPKAAMGRFAESPFNPNGLIPSVNKGQRVQRWLERTRTRIPRASRFIKTGMAHSGASAVLLRPCRRLFPFTAGAIAFFGWKTGAGLADEAAGRSPADKESAAGHLFGITKTVFPLAAKGRLDWKRTATKRKRSPSILMAARGNGQDKCSSRCGAQASAAHRTGFSRLLWKPALL